MKCYPRMVLCLQKIEQTISTMDETYDANFGNWIRNEDNCKIVGTNMKRYIEKYKPSEFIIVAKWIIKDWTLKSIILFSRKLIIEDLYTRPADEYKRRIKIITGFVYTWNPIFIAEFLLSSANGLDSDFQASLFVDILKAFDTKKLGDILAQMEDKLDKSVRVQLSKRFTDGVYGPHKNDLDRTDSLTNAFTML